jgi:EmrB/QacA subfamily drug resistance transporter
LAQDQRHLLNGAHLQVLSTSSSSAADAAASANAPALRWALASLCLSMLMPSLDTSIANAGLPALAQAFGASFQAVQWIVLAYLLAITTLIVSAGRLGDLLGRRRLLQAGILLFTLASLLCGVAGAFWFLVAARALQGLGAAVMLALTIASVSETVPKEKIGSTMGLLGTMSAIGTTLGPSLGGLLIGSLGWRAIFLVNIPIGLINLMLARRYLPARSQASKAVRPVFDYQGTVVLAASLAAYALAMTVGQGSFGVRNAGLLLVAVICLAYFVSIERKAASPLIRLAMLRQPGLSGSLAMSMLVATVIMTTLVVGPFYLSRTLGLQAASVGLVLSVGPLVSALAGIPAGRLVDRFGARRMNVAGLGSMLAGCLLIASLPASDGVPGYLLSILCLTAGYALFQAANNTAIMSDVGAEQRGVVSGMLSLSRNLGLITSAAAMGAVFSFASGASDMITAAGAAIAHGMHVTFGLAAALITCALLIAVYAHWHAQDDIA